MEYIFLVFLVFSLKTNEIVFTGEITISFTAFPSPPPTHSSCRLLLFGVFH